MSRDKIKSLYLHLHRNYKHQTWHSVDLGWGASTYQVKHLIDHLVIWCYMTIKMLYLLLHRTYERQSWRSGDLGWGARSHWPSHNIPWSCHRWQRGLNLPYILKTPLILPTPPFSSFVQPTPLLSWPLIDLSVVLFIWLNGWSRHIWCIILIMLWMYTCQGLSSLATLVPEGPWCVFNATKHKVYWDQTHNMVFCWFYDLILHPYKHAHTERHTGHPGASRLTHSY